MITINYINAIKNGEKISSSILYLKSNKLLDLSKYVFFGNNELYLIFLNYDEAIELINKYKNDIIYYKIVVDSLNSRVPLLDYKNLKDYHH